MSHKSKFLFVLLGYLLVSAFLSAQTITVGESVSSLTFDLSTESDHLMSKATIDIKMAYDMEDSTLLLTIFPHMGQYDMLWLPQKYYDLQSLKKHNKAAYRAKTSIRKTFKRQAVFGLGPAFKLTNCSIVKYPDSESIKDKNNATFIFKVHNPENIVRIDLVCAVPVNASETSMGRTRYTYNYVAAPVSMELQMQEDPCRRKTTLELTNTLSAYRDTLVLLYNELVENAKKNNSRRCNDIKQTISEKQEACNEYVELANEISNCDNINNLLEEITELLENTSSVKWEVAKPTRSDNSAIVKEIRKQTRDLNNSYNCIRSGIEVAKNREKLERIIREMDGKINDWNSNPGVRNSQAVKEAIQTYKGRRDKAASIL